MSNSSLKSEYKLAVVGVLSLLSAIFMMWQLSATTNELDKIFREQESQYDFMLNTIRESREKQ
ncbi:MAG: hypothetical protein A3F26_00935 [Candidatus Ryanbacteria bacterium RIFCSPHIGHO2_12_FULL_47_12b]|uniref:Uncharacterized protein n=2 Tax=Candidatus Ryaniibacteriota TaxID=1817914 RepID=A0A1G2H5N6_9BACT|nr:MAG: hypothetical protein UX74_C0004G0010 [Parcubacteria group bacterium GW2011_GWA2_47_10b]KKU85424.1 MAG: hypothetical protein UY14_C0024G0008 [Parcubacteria group bacterium GW2011_GWA1_47_9]OGZ46513.1 MAG: hypothetical protein A2844_01340 [Candidatus Ryanbacteria bacterium RIFCSPHIGHO2_01_FULL_48_80]OGZ48612.1 MAG: hypothetical protein A3C83_00830 [Candidatus Ryanbacteria bacterium RIFCSPHIGHO2_02_FULL_47_25]OGZ52526.1 MAG: hypothetical protein A3F26_00935 [Candidatus Ryanbacteria bacteri